MKNSTKRTLILIAVFSLVLSVLVVLSGCYVVKSASMKQVEGTYKLTVYSGEGDYLTDRGITLFIVLKSDGTGYYAYKSNNTEPHIAELRCRYTPDPENSSRYEYVEMDFDGDGEYDRFAINASLTSTNLNSQRPEYSGDLIQCNVELDYYVHADFTRVDRATDLSYINENFGTYDVLPFGALRFDGMFEFSEVIANTDYMEMLESPYVYAYIDINVLAGTAKTWFMTKELGAATEQSHEIKFVKDEGGFYILVDNKFILTPDTSLYPYSCYLNMDADGATIKFRAIGNMSDEDREFWMNKYHEQYLVESLHASIESEIRGLMSFECKVYHGEGVECDCDKTVVNVADPSKYSVEKFERIDGLIARYLGKFYANENSISYDLLSLYKKARLYFLYEDAIANLEKAYEASQSVIKDNLKSICLNQINGYMNKSYTFSAMLVCEGHEEGIECDCDTYILVEDVASEGLKKFTEDYCNDALYVNKE